MLAVVCAGVKATAATSACHMLLTDMDDRKHDRNTHFASGSNEAFDFLTSTNHLFPIMSSYSSLDKPAAPKAFIFDLLTALLDSWTLWTH